MELLIFSLKTVKAPPQFTPKGPSVNWLTLKTCRKALNADFVVFISYKLPMRHFMTMSVYMSLISCRKGMNHAFFLYQKALCIALLPLMITFPDLQLLTNFSTLPTEFPMIMV